ncbi:hypothetical protein [Streptomyces albipurpureus]|uniref:Uncharacterized protein n=1 Tax=Streptomyces albipurpureus TaxID=2897419 RepID=A0ABT0V1J1_9ACTN|nr:hypothetical protein [Streptomyces sp. CWNU-1]MCM2394386.1 hypothetical protein [Streptomyces sp. CWNU-1]
MWNGLVSVVKETYTGSSKGAVPRLLMMPLVRGELVPPIQAAVNFSFTPIELDHPDQFGVTVVLMEEDGYRVSLTEAFAR